VALPRHECLSRTDNDIVDDDEDDDDNCCANHCIVWTRFQVYQHRSSSQHDSEAVLADEAFVLKESDTVGAMPQSRATMPPQ